jgi:hypothetical protein
MGPGGHPLLGLRMPPDQEIRRTDGTTHDLTHALTHWFGTRTTTARLG